MTDAPKPPKVNPSPFLPQPKPVEPKPVEPIEHTEQFEQVQPQVQKPVQPKPVEPVQVEAPKPQPKVEQTTKVQPIPKEQEVQSTPVQKSTKVTNAISVLESIDKTGTDEQGIKAIAKELASMTYEELKQVANHFGIEPVNDTRAGTYFALDQWLDKINQPKPVEQKVTEQQSPEDFVSKLSEGEDERGKYWTLPNVTKSPWSLERMYDLRNAVIQGYSKVPKESRNIDPKQVLPIDVELPKGRDLEYLKKFVQEDGPLEDNVGDHLKLIEGNDGKLYMAGNWGWQHLLRALAYGQTDVPATIVKESDVPKGKEELRNEQEQEELKIKFKPLERLDSDAELSKLADYIAGAEERYEKEHNVLSKALLDAWEQKEEANKVFKEMDRANADNEAFYESPEYIEADARRVELRIKHLEIQDQFDSIRQRMNEEVHKALVVPQEQQTTFNGTPTDTADTWTKKAMGEANKFLQAVLSNDALKTRGEQVKYKVDQIKPTDEQRASYTQASQMVNASVGMPIKTMVHEIGHHLEHIIPGAFNLAKLFLDKRVGTKNKPVRLEDKLPGHGYRPYEYSMGDDDFGKLFNNPALAFYIAKIYSNATEVISMGLEMLYENPIKLAHTDPDLFKFIVGILRGKHK